MKDGNLYSSNTVSGFEVIDYGGGDLHIQDNTTTTGVTIRIGRQNNAVTITSQGNELIPWSINGLSAILVVKGK